MGKFDEDYRRYRLYGVDHKVKQTVIFTGSSIERIDSFTKKFYNKDDLLAQLSERYEINFLDFYIESKGNKQNDNIPGKRVNDILYKENIIPDIDTLQETYIEYLLEKRSRIKKSFAKYKPKFAKEDVNIVTIGELRSSVRGKIKSYMNIREVYFELLKNGKINSGKIEFDYVKELNELDKQNLEFDYSASLINNADTEYSDDYDGIMLEKVRSGEVEPFEYFDTEDYVRMQIKGRKK